ncbi:Myb-related transcription factor, partner of profilin-like [Oopsacas minuta]|uniref:Myb-related transcription factor, partner of profilin-like n=2 Tax=Oopsacas minuta TaxID=111878 RepID=A0AAV7JNB6_9METZ|nr:Myb-related transcription factor, partner of profilin-like [Oopsacas minuta]KAI6655563.1 Myb-related transcription factor, partner of profilin-like [Oopsacas minuta]KAI6660141.1 Myb-related transcription factor, partner of profilin-like [Oopsacas minuta]KAI6660218.1 Myb-related transcription factor, partner of profilin-like [Oopsacas minuta]
MDKVRKVNWTKEEEYTLIEAIQDAGDILRGTAGQCAEINKKKTRLWNNVMRKINSIHGNNRDVKDIKKKWNNLKGSAKARVDSSRREARRTGGGPNEAGEVEDEDIRILSSDRELSTSVTERVSQIFSSTPAFTGICGSVDMFQAPTALPSHTEISESSEVTPVFEGPEVTVVNSRPEGRRKRKRSIEQSTSVSDLLPLQREVLLKQMEVFSAQLELIEEQREYYRYKKQRLLEKDQQQQL